MSARSGIEKGPLCAGGPAFDAGILMYESAKNIFRHGYRLEIHEYNKNKTENL
jgi:hypothetical protein